SKPGLGRICVTRNGAGACTDERFVAVFGGGFDRERKNRRGNWLYVVDVETGTVLMKANSSCGVNAAAGCTPVYFGSIPSEPALLDTNSDGVADVVYVGDVKGQLWRVDLTDLRMLPSPPPGRFENKIDFSSGSARPFLLF